MDMTIAYPIARTLHIVLGALWAGAAFQISILLAPVLIDVKQAGTDVIARLVARRELHFFMLIASATTLFSGFFLFWQMTGGLQPTLLKTSHAIVYLLGGISAVVAGILGKNVIGTAAVNIAALAHDGSPESKVHIEALKARMKNVGRVAICFMVFTLICMAGGHFVP